MSNSSFSSPTFSCSSFFQQENVGEENILLVLWLIGTCACANYFCQFPRIDRTGLRSDPQFAFHLAAIAPDHLHHPQTLAIAIFLFDLSRSRLVGQMRADVVVSDLARLVQRDIQRAR